MTVTSKTYTKLKGASAPFFYCKYKRCAARGAVTCAAYPRFLRSASGTQ